MPSFRSSCPWIFSEPIHSLGSSSEQVCRVDFGVCARYLIEYREQFSPASTGQIDRKVAPEHASMRAEQVHALIEEPTKNAQIIAALRRRAAARAWQLNNKRPATAKRGKA
jgi:hypothetical protein